ncbi:MAG: hypothetical protein Kow0068_09650 [Marinilabiliales bacterium]
MRIIEANTKDDIKKFYQVENLVYNNIPYYRSTENEIIKLLITGPTNFHTHAEITPYLIYDDQKLIGRFALVHDLRMFDIVQVAFFESLNVVYDPVNLIIPEVKFKYPDCHKIVIGLNGHLNYGAGILQNNFDKVPAFGLSYTPSYYPALFEKYKKNNIVTYSFPVKVKEKYLKKLDEFSDNKTYNIRKFNRKNLSNDFLTYTELNNKCFTEHPYWSERDGIEDLELFEPFKYLLKDENLIFAEYNGQAIGFLLWFPDFNQLVNTQRELKAGNDFAYDVLRYKLFNPIKRFRFAEIGVVPEFRKKGVELVLINTMVRDVLKHNYKTGVGGFIFEKNLDSVNMAVKYMERIVGEPLHTDNKYAVYEINL